MKLRLILILLIIQLQPSIATNLFRYSHEKCTSSICEGMVEYRFKADAEFSKHHKVTEGTMILGKNYYKFDCVNHTMETLMAQIGNDETGEVYETTNFLEEKDRNKVPVPNNERLQAIETHLCAGAS